MSRIGHPRATVPALRLLDARDDSLDDDGLRARAREMSGDAETGHVARSYRYPYGLVAWHDEPVGIDIERVEECDDAFADLICTPIERLRAASAADRDSYLTSLWSSKEALSKALGDALRYEPSRLESPLHWPDGRSGPWRATALEVPSGHVGWLCWRTTAAA
jgi:4'-phosphopantetheinyl transferase superfamily